MFNSSTVESLKKKSQGILDVFSKTVNDLNAVNEKIETEVSNRHAEISRLTSESYELETQKAANAKVATKITEFLQG
jgi:hypothetical protein